MSLNLDNLKETIEEHKNILIENDKKLLPEHDNLGLTVLNTSKIVATNNALVVTQWALDTLDGKRMYISGKYQRFDTMTLDLSTLNIIEGMQFRLKAVVMSGDDSLGIEVLQYEPEINTVMYELGGNAFKTTLQLTSVIPYSTL